jgi:archaellum component FlaG (FlaF/FlaG flagellin family)
MILHGSSQATGVVLVDGSIQPGDVVTVTIEDRSYTYFVQPGDTLDSVRDALVEIVNQDPKVSASAGIAFARNFILKARVAGPGANGLAFSTSVAGPSGASGAQLILTPETTSLCCANTAFSPVTAANPAVPGEVLLVYATGLGLPVLSEANQNLIQTGVKYPQGGPITQPVNFVSSLAGGKTANILSASLKPGTVGTYEVLLQLNSSMTTNPLTNVYIAQDVYISNIVTFALVSPTQ